MRFGKVLTFNQALRKPQTKIALRFNDFIILIRYYLKEY